MRPSARQARAEHSARRAAANNLAILGEVRAAVLVMPRTAGALLSDRAAYWKQPSQRRRDSQNILRPKAERTHSGPECARLQVLKPEFGSKGLAPGGAILGLRLRCGRRCRSADSA